MLDNYDSFTYNLVQYLSELGAEVTVARNDAVTPDAVLRESYDGIVISPGPGGPAEAGISEGLIRAAAGRVPVLGVCLGHQALGEVYGARVVRAERLMHGKTSPVSHRGGDLFQGIPSPFEATRYHSLILAPDSVASPLVVTAETEAGEIMAVRHAALPLYGVQFHPESILTPSGKTLLANFLAVCRNTPVASADPAGSTA